MRMVLDPLVLELQVALSSLTWVLGTELRFSPALSLTSEAHPLGRVVREL